MLIEFILIINSVQKDVQSKYIAIENKWITFNIYLYHIEEKINDLFTFR